MKKFLMALMAVLFLGATGMVFADGTTTGSTPAPKAHKGHHRKAHKGHKAKNAAAPAPSTSEPAAK